MKARQSQENFFRYSRQEFNLDTLASYSKVDVDDTVEAVNPKFRQLEKSINSTRGKLARRHLKRSESILADNATDKQQKKYGKRQGDLTAEIEELDEILLIVREGKKVTEHYIQIKDLPEDIKFKTLHGGRKNS
jgi:Transposase protein